MRMHQNSNQADLNEILWLGSKTLISVHCWQWVKDADENKDSFESVFLYSSIKSLIWTDSTIWLIDPNIAN